MRAEFVIISVSDFFANLNPESHFKNKFYSVFLFENSSGSIIIDDQKYDLQADKLFFINYNQAYQFKNFLSSTGNVIMFTKTFYNYIYTGNKLIKSDTALHDVSPFLSLTKENKSDLFGIFGEIQEEYNLNKTMRKEILCLLVKIFMLKYIRNSPKKKRILPEVNHKKEIVENFVQLVNLHYKEIKTTSKYAEKLNITPNYLNALVKENMNISAGKAIRNRIILEAERLLLHTTLSVTEISYELGFNDNSHFGKFFKTEKKLAPNTYRLLKIADNN